MPQMKITRSVSMLTGYGLEGPGFESRQEQIFTYSPWRPPSTAASKPWSFTLTKSIRIKVLENRMLGNIFCSEKDTAPEEWRELHNEEFRKLYSSPNIFRSIKKNGGKWDGQTTWCGREILSGFWWGKQIERDLLQDPGIDTRPLTL